MATVPYDEILSIVRSNLQTIQRPSNSAVVYKDECQFTFDTPETDGGLFINLITLQSVGTRYLDFDRSRTKCSLYIQEIFFAKLEKPDKVDDAGETKSETPSVLGIGVAGGFDSKEKTYTVDKKYNLIVFPSDSASLHEAAVLPTTSEEYLRLPEFFRKIVDEVLLATDSFVSKTQDTWQDVREISRFSLDMIQLDNGVKVSPDPSTWKCQTEGCDKTEGLWMNLHDGYIACGRRAFDGSGGNGHALAHYMETNSLYPLCVKLGTITSTGADVYSYAPEEDDMVQDPHLEAHLQHFGLNLKDMKKTEKSLAEMEIDLNSNYDFSNIMEADMRVNPYSAPWFMGLENFGNTCYINSLVQVLCDIPEFSHQFASKSLREAIFETSACSVYSPVADDLLLQTAKLFSGISDPNYVALPNSPSSESTNEPDKPAEDRPGRHSGILAPRSFRYLVGKNHPDFSTNKQQDILDFFDHLCSLYERSYNNIVSDRRAIKDMLPPVLSDFFKFHTETRMMAKCDDPNCSVCTHGNISSTIGTKDGVVCGACRYNPSVESYLQIPIPKEIVSLAKEKLQKKLGISNVSDSVAPDEKMAESNACSSNSSTANANAPIASSEEPDESISKRARLSPVEDLTIPHTDSATDTTPDSASNPPSAPAKDAVGGKNAKDRLVPTVPFSSLLQMYLASDVLGEIEQPVQSEGMSDTKTYKALLSTRLVTCPKYLNVVLGRYFISDDYSIKKIDARVPMPLQMDLADLASMRDIPVVHNTPTAVELKKGEETMNEPIPSQDNVSEEFLKELAAEIRQEIPFAPAALSAGGPIPGAPVLPSDLKITSHAGTKSSAEAPAIEAKVETKRPNKALVDALMELGFPEGACCRASLSVDGGVECIDAAMEWLLTHSEDPDYDSPFVLPDVMLDSLKYVTTTPASAGIEHHSSSASNASGSNAKSSPPEVSEESLAILLSMGLEEKISRKALQQCGGSIEAATEWVFNHMEDSSLLESTDPVLTAVGNSVAPDAPLTVDWNSSTSGKSDYITFNSQESTTSTKYELMAIVSHLGASTTSGHYITHVRKSKSGLPPGLNGIADDGTPTEWYIFNDGKVAVSKNPPLDAGYMYFYRRV